MGRSDHDVESNDNKGKNPLIGTFIISVVVITIIVFTYFWQRG